jgi:hypothetical protein
VNLRELREEIHAALDYNPDAKVYDDSLTRVINRHYLQVSSQYQWLFMQKKDDILLRADIAGDTVSTMTSDGSRRLLLAIPALGITPILLPKAVEGQTFLLDDVEYEITQRIDARVLVVDKPIAAGTHSDWKIQFQRFPLPRDCVEVLGVMDRGIKNTETIVYKDGVSNTGTEHTFTKTTTAPNRGRFTFLDSKKEEYLYLDAADTGDPFISVEEMHSNVSPPDFAPVISARSSADASQFVDEGTYEYCYTFLYAGRESPPSPASSVKVGTGSQEVKVELIRTSALRVIPGTIFSHYTGRLKKIYRRLSIGSETEPGHYKNGAGVWRHIATVSEATIRFYDKGLEQTISTVYPGDSFVNESGALYDSTLLNESGPHQYLRFWYTPSSDYKVEMRYHKRPLRLVNDADAPDWPVQYHHYLVYATLRDVCLQHGLSSYSQLYGSRAVDLLEKMKNKYLSRSDRVFIRRGFDRAMADRERWGIPSKS